MASCPSMASDVALGMSTISDDVQVATAGRRVTIARLHLSARNGRSEPPGPCRPPRFAYTAIATPAPARTSRAAAVMPAAWQRRPRAADISSRNPVRRSPARVTYGSARRMRSAITSGASTSLRRQIENPKEDRLVRQFLQDRAVERGLRRFDRDLLHAWSPPVPEETHTEPACPSPSLRSQSRCAPPWFPATPSSARCSAATP